MDELQQAIAEWIDGFERDFEALQKRLNKTLRAAEAAVLRKILERLIPSLETSDGFLGKGIRNMAKASIIERVFDEVGRDEIIAALAEYAAALIAITGKNAAYYYAIGIDKKKVAAIAEDLTLIRGVIGVDDKGKLLKDGFLYRLGRSEVVRESLKQYVLTSIATGQKLADFQAGIKTAIVGAKDISGALVGYWNSYAYDAYSKVREVDNLHFKDEIGLKHFMYQGGIVEGSRDFCRKKNGKVFTEAEAVKQWPKDPDLIDKKTVSRYNPLLDRGRYNCRHFLMWITEERYNELKER